jgi:hypothetical protein
MSTHVRFDCFHRYCVCLRRVFIGSLCSVQLRVPSFVAISDHTLTKNCRQSRPREQMWPQPRLGSECHRCQMLCQSLRVHRSRSNQRAMQCCQVCVCLLVCIISQWRRFQVRDAPSVHKSFVKVHCSPSLHLSGCMFPANAQ